MISVSMAFAALALAGAAPAQAKPPVHKPATSEQTAKKKTAPKKAKAAPGKTAPADASAKEAKPAKTVEISVDAARVADWVGSSGDNQSLPYVIVDKPAARAYLYDAEGKLLANAPVLIGKALGDEATPGIGAKSLSEIGPAEKTTPAGRFLAKFGFAAGQQKVLWVDYATSVALHTIPVGNKENRKARMLSPTIDDNRITFGCINVPQAFYKRGVEPLFAKKGGYVYVLPDSTPIEDVFPRLRVQSFVTTTAAAGN
ncbi:hypothetical protein EDF56_101981 [Novosphingobium sp. PhB165]|uniref:L,D-transpeptidase n=1 Tax=Novosphingobium sp. PhB165 TaxID=2485105 RepID=UPI00104DA08B|nr:L,D-transpeptidase [Novosphingobium sp. PhB165]TCM22294.1 hypothetical protein EDF56_101981 [Novosphingobium sp. PhB165]